MTMMDSRDRAWLYECLSDLFSGAAPDLGAAPGPGRWPPLVAEALASLTAAAADPARLAVEYARLFVNAPGGVAAPPYASWYLDGRILGPSSEWAARAYASQGLSIDTDAGEPPDHVSAELEFMYFLARHETAARATGDARSLSDTLAAQATFLLRLSQWVPRFVENVLAADPQPIYEAGARLLRATVAEDAASRLPR